MSKETFYFSHDYNASMDEKIVKLLSKHGMPGYGIFWRIVENLYNNANALQIDYDRIAYDLHIEDSEIVRSVINDFGLFSVEGTPGLPSGYPQGTFGSMSIERRLDERNKKSEKARQSAFKRWDKNKADANAPKNDANAPKNDAIKESIVKESIVMSDVFNTDYKPTDVFSSLAFQLWKQCYNNQVAKNIKPTILNKAKPGIWANEMRLIIEADGRTETEIIEILNFLKTDIFWSGNVQSPDKLRKQFERLQLEMRREPEASEDANSLRKRKKITHDTI